MCCVCLMILLLNDHGVPGNESELCRSSVRGRIFLVEQEAWTELRLRPMVGRPWPHLQLPESSTDAFAWLSLSPGPDIALLSFNLRPKQRKRTFLFPFSVAIKFFHFVLW